MKLSTLNSFSVIGVILVVTSFFLLRFASPSTDKIEVIIVLAVLFIGIFFVVFSEIKKESNDD